MPEDTNNNQPPTPDEATRPVGFPRARPSYTTGGGRTIQPLERTSDTTASSTPSVTSDVKGTTETPLEYPVQDTTQTQEVAPAVDIPDATSETPTNEALLSIESSDSTHDVTSDTPTPSVGDAPVNAAELSSSTPVQANVDSEHTLSAGTTSFETSPSPSPMTGSAMDITKPSGDSTATLGAASAVGAGVVAGMGSMNAAAGTTGAGGVIGGSSTTIPQSAPQPMSSMGTKTRKKSKLPLIISLIVLVLLLGGGYAAYALWYQKPEKVVMDAMKDALAAKNTSLKIRTVKMDVTGDQFSSGPIKFKRIDVDASGNTTPSMTQSATIFLDVVGKEVPVNGQVSYPGDGNLYFKIDKLDVLVENLRKDATYGQQLAMYDKATLDNLVTAVQSKWVKVSAEYLKKQSAEAKLDTKCIQDVYAKYKDDKSLDVQAGKIYEQHPYYSIDKKVADRDGNMGFKVSVNKATYEKYSDAMNKLEVSKEMQKCFGMDSNREMGAASRQEDQYDETTELYISTFGHKLKSVQMSQKTKDTNKASAAPEGMSSMGLASNAKIDAVYKIDVDTDTKVTVQAPADAKDYEKWMADVQAASQKMMPTTAPAPATSTSRSSSTMPRT